MFNVAVEYKFKRRLNEQKCTSVVIYLLNLAYVDGKFDAAERLVISEICDGFDLGRAKFDLFARFEREFKDRHRDTTAKKSPYEVLELPAGASFEQVKSQYRKLARKYHPDFLGGNADKSVVADATKKLQEINEAYGELKAEFERQK